MREGGEARRSQALFGLGPGILFPLSNSTLVSRFVNEKTVTFAKDGKSWLTCYWLSSPQTEHRPQAWHLLDLTLASAPVRHSNAFQTI